jgi:hypothetical protein
MVVRAVEIVAALVALIALDIAGWYWGVDSRVVMDDERQVHRPSRRWI